jgi:hypothetical protein
LRRALVLPLLLAPLAVIAGCSSEPALSGIGEPLFVYGATFIAGPLPGSPPLDGGMPATPEVTAINAANAVLHLGQAGVPLSGDVTDDATAVAVRFPEAGTGYWLFVPGPPDGTSPGALSWSTTMDVGYTAPLGVQPLRFAAVNAAGASGMQHDLPVCVDAVIPDNLNACAAGIAPPAAVLSLAWDTPVDLDLELVTPSGVVVSPTHPSTSASSTPGPDDGVLDRDSDADCVPDHVNREDIVWQHAPAPGQYLAYANLFSACGQPSVRFTLTLYVAEPVDAGKETALQQKLQQSGELLAVQESGGVGMGLYVAAFSFPPIP